MTEVSQTSFFTFPEHYKTRIPIWLCVHSRPTGFQKKTHFSPSASVCVCVCVCVCSYAYLSCLIRCSFLLTGCQLWHQMRKSVDFLVSVFLTSAGEPLKLFRDAEIGLAVEWKDGCEKQSLLLPSKKDEILSGLPSHNRREGLKSRK